MKIVNSFLQFFFDSLFPIDKNTSALLSITPENVFRVLPPAPATPYPFIKSIFAYKNDLVASLIWNIKYKKSPKAIEIGGYALYEVLITNYQRTFNLAFDPRSALAKDRILLIPIPISQKRKNERGFNQCELLLDEIIRLDTKKQFLFSKSLLKRKIHKDRQTLKNRANRLKDARQIFEIDSSELEKMKGQFGAKVIVIDDVVTTGSTIKEAVDLLRSSGFVDVVGLSVAH